jgi:transcriptional regulator with GAF, ATPase, and Fis domain
MVFNQENGTAEEMELGKDIMTIGSSITCDLRVASQGISDVHCHISFDGEKYIVARAEPNSTFLLNGKKVNRGILTNGSVIDIGNRRIIFVENFKRKAAVEASEDGRIDAIEKIVKFSERLMSSYTLDDLLDNLMEYVVKLTHSDNGFLLLFENGKIKLKSAFGIKPELMKESIDRLSDTIISRVIREKKAVVVSDAISDDEFKNAESVVNLNLHSVMCIPLSVKDKFLGLIYLGSQSVKNLFNDRDLEIIKIFASQASLLIHNATLLGELRTEHIKLIDKLGESTLGPLIGNSGVMQNMFREIKAISADNMPVLIIGEDGTEKESVAFTIHKESGRKGQFGILKAGIYNELQFDIEFSGVVKGGLPGAMYTKKGKVHLCKNGTLYIEDVEKLSENLQLKLLGLIKEGFVTKVGSATPEKVDVRMVFSSVNLAHAVQHSGFNKELYNCIVRSVIIIPPLRERKEDIELLANHFLNKFAKQYGKSILGFTPDALRFLKLQDWAGNISEFENRVRRAVLLSENEFITADDMEL